MSHPKPYLHLYLGYYSLPHWFKISVAVDNVQKEVHTKSVHEGRPARGQTGLQRPGEDGHISSTTGGAGTENRVASAVAINADFSAGCLFLSIYIIQLSFPCVVRKQQNYQHITEK